MFHLIIDTSANYLYALTSRMLKIFFFQDVLTHELHKSGLVRVIIHHPFKLRTLIIASDIVMNHNVGEMVAGSGL